MSLLQQSAALGVAAVVAKATLLLLLGVCGTLALHRAPAAARHLVWLIVIAGALLSIGVARVAPVRLALLPNADVPLTVVPSGAGVVQESGSATVATADRSGGIERLTSHGIVGIAPPRYWTLAVGTWVAGAAALVAWLLAGMLSVRRIVRRGRVMDAPEWMDTVADAAGRLGLTHVPRLIVSERVGMAFACDALAPTIVVPADAADWSDDRRRAVLLHEMAHLRRRDLVAHTIARVACAVYWFHPLMWVAARRLRAESEQACDDVVIASGVRASDYAQHLLDMVAGLGRHVGAPAAALPIVRPGEFESRLLAILGRAKRRSTVRRAEFTALAAVFGLWTMSIAAIAPVRRADAASRVQSAQPTGPSASASPVTQSLPSPLLPIAPYLFPRYATAAKAAEAQGATYPRARSATGKITERRCVDAGRPAGLGTGVARSGEFTAAGFAVYGLVWHQGGAKLSIGPAPSRYDTLSIEARRLDETSAAVRDRVVHFRVDHVATSLDGTSAGYIFKDRLPSPGVWLLVAHAGTSWGCFLFAFQ